MYVISRYFKFDSNHGIREKYLNFRQLNFTSIILKCMNLFIF